MADAIVVPDASVLLKWVLRPAGEEDGDRALAFKSAWLAGDCEIIVPTLWAFEVGNVLGIKQADTAHDLLSAMFDLRLPEVAPATYAAGMCRLMRDYRVTCYDAAYHALAIAHKGTMLTADRKYARKASGAGHIRLLSDWPTS
jgi:predicted nucleic acid-binding protein